uniref:Triacylglycerol lipase n=1 Tax=Glossina pallidipes TaxID=7398 RepID=A0A1A9Z4C2_GLOPL
MSINLFYCLLVVTIEEIFLRPINADVTDAEDKALYFLKMSGIRRQTFNWDKAKNGELLVTNLENMRDALVNVRATLQQQAADNKRRLQSYNWKQGKIQKPVEEDVPFPCNLNNVRSTEPPTTVDRLRPGDIDVVAAIGDSLSSGNGALSQHILHLVTEFRGLSFSGGGAANWRKYLTLPNILKVFNPNLYGYATDSRLAIDKSAYLNIAEPIMMSRDLEYQSRVLIARMRQDPHIDMERHWKLLTIFVGNNDFCTDFCHYDNKTIFLRNHEKDLLNAFRLLKANVPRLLVNLLTIPNLITSLHNHLKKVNWMCQTIQRFVCHCIFSDRYDNNYIQMISNLMQQWQDIDQRLANLAEFQTDNFAVIFHPFVVNASFPLLSNGALDMRYLSNDCFHFSQLGQATAANALWNSMLQPDGQKQVDMNEPFNRFECPSITRPFIATLRNTAKVTS